MKKYLLLIILTISSLFAVEPIFYCNFDDTIVPKIGTAGNSENTPVFQDSIKGKGILIGTDENGNKFGVAYPQKNNLDDEQGSLSFWFKPINWKGTDTGFFHMLFDAKVGNNYFYVYKYLVTEKFYFLRGELGFWLFAQAAPGEWKKEQWQHIVCTWDKVSLAIYVNGKLVTERRIYFPVKEFDENNKFTIGEQSYSMKTKEGRLSLMDEFKIFNRVLTPNEIYELYSNMNYKLEPKNLITVGKGKESFKSLGFTNVITGEYANDDSYTLGFDDNNLYLKTPQAQLILTDPQNKEHIFNLQKGNNTISLKKIGIKENVDGWKFRLLANDNEIKTSKFKLSTIAPKIIINSLFDLNKNIIDLDINRINNAKVFFETDTTENYGFNRIIRDLNKNLKYNKNLDNFLLTYLRIEENGKPIFRQNITVRRKQPMTVKFLYTLIKEKKIRVALYGTAKGKIKLSVCEPKSLKDVYSYTKNIPKNALSFFDLDFPIDCKAGDYIVKISYINDKGNVYDIYSQGFRVPPKNDPLVKPYVSKDAGKLPPGGWSKVVANDCTVEVWGRKIDLTDGVLFSSIISQNEELLTAPMQLILNGKLLEGTNTIKKISSNDLNAQYLKISDYGLLKVESNIDISFDGYAKINMKIVPKGNLNIDTLTLQVPMNPKASKLVRDGYALSKNSGLLKKDISISLLKFPVLWIGNYHVGLNFTAENLKNWTFTDAKRQLDIIKEKKSNNLNFLLINKSIQLDKEYSFDFGFTVTPTKPLNKSLLRKQINVDWQMWFNPWKYFNNLNSKFIKTESPFGGMDYYNRTVEGFKELFFYTAYNFTDPFAPEWTYYEQLWRQIKHNRTYGIWTGFHGGYCEGCINCDSYKNYRLNNLYNFINEPNNPMLKENYRNFYFDAPWEESCYNKEHGCELWTNSLGQKNVSILVNRYREMAIDIYRMIKAQGDDAKISYHAEYAKFIPCMTFADVLTGGEGQEDEVAAKGSYYDILTPDIFCATFSPYIYGAKTAIIPQLERGLSLKYPVKHRTYNIHHAEYRKAVRHFIGLAALHDADIWHRDEIINTWKAAQKKLLWDDNTKFFPYYDNCGVETLPKSERILTSAYSNSGNLMLVILNDTDNKEQVTINLDLDKLGVNSGLLGYDIFNEEFTVKLDKTLNINMENRGCKILLFLKPTK